MHSAFFVKRGAVVDIGKSVKLQIGLIFVLVVGVYYPSLFASFNSIDDLKMINYLINTDEFTVRQLFIPNSYGQYYRPLLYLTFIADKSLWGLEASFMHLENVLLHLSNTLLLFGLVRQHCGSFSTEKDKVPLVVSLLFGLHPIATEPVNWVSGRTDLLAGLFVLASFLLFLQSMRGASWWRWLLGALLFLAGCLSKETALFLLPVILLFTLLPSRGDYSEIPLAKRFLLAGMFATAGGIYLLLRWLALSGGDKIVRTTVKVTNGDTPVEITAAMKIVVGTAGYYFKKLLMPLPLNFGIESVSPHYFWLGLVAIAGVTLCLYSRNIIAYYFLAAFMLTSSAFVLPILKITWTPIAERYAYIAAAPFIAGVSLLYLKYLSKKIPARLTTGVTALLLGGSAVVTAQRSVIWQDNYTLYKDTIEKSPRFGTIINEYAIALRERGQGEEADRIMLSNVIDPFQPSSLNRIRVLTNKGQLDEARSLLLERMKQPQEYNQASMELLVTIDECRLGKYSDPEKRQSIDRDILAGLQNLAAMTGDPFYHYKSGKIQIRLHDTKNAKSSFEKAWHNAPRNSHYKEAARRLAESL